MFQPQDPNIFQLGNRRTENLVSRGGGRIWNPQTQQWDKYWNEESYQGPYGLTFTYNPLIKDWFQLVNSGAVNMAGRGQRRGMPSVVQGQAPEQEQPDFMSMFGPYITGEHLRS